MRGASTIRQLWAQARWTLRRRRLLRHPGMEIAPTVRMAPTAQIQLCPDWFEVGGTVRIGPGVRISDGAILAPYGGSIALGENAFVGPYCVLYGHGGLTIGRDTMIAAHTVIIPANHEFRDPDRPILDQGLSSLGIAIGDGVWVGCGVRILDGVSIGDGCVIGAGAVVTRSLEPLSIAAGVPARVVGARAARSMRGGALSEVS